MTRPMLYPIETHSGGHYLPTPRTVATFFTWADAADFIADDPRNLYFGDPLYDRRKRGYRPVPVDSGYLAWCAEVDAIQLTQCSPNPLRRCA